MVFEWTNVDLHRRGSATVFSTLHYAFGFRCFRRLACGHWAPETQKWSQLRMVRVWSGVWSDTHEED